ncbi:hypothetical protein AFLA_011989 [Aspergillus flavus NRRL3357]|nr:hypothetical protein AFLA_011989 [Aspergillus flavus NRRL3357]
MCQAGPSPPSERLNFSVYRVTSLSLEVKYLVFKFAYIYPRTDVYFFGNVQWRLHGAVLIIVLLGLCRSYRYVGHHERVLPKGEETFRNPESLDA